MNLRRHLGTLLRWAAGLALSLAMAAATAGAYEDFFRAVEVDDAAAVRQLLARGMDPNTLDPRGQHALFLALRGGSAKVFEALMQHPDTRVETANANDETALMMAALRADVGAMASLVARGAAINRTGWTPLHYAASSPSPAPVQWLLDRGAAVDARAPNGNTPLMLAARYGHEDSVTLLLARGADRNLRNANDLDAAAYARLDGREPVARRLEAGKP